MITIAVIDRIIWIPQIIRITVTEETSYELAKEYVISLNNSALLDSFGTLEISQWFDVLPELLKELRK